MDAMIIPSPYKDPQSRATPVPSSKKPKKPKNIYEWPDFSVSKREDYARNECRTAIATIACIADQQMWTMSQLPLDNWPASKTEVAYEFLLANIQQLEMICRGPLREIQTAISKNWPAILDEEWDPETWWVRERDGYERWVETSKYRGVIYSAFVACMDAWAEIDRHYKYIVEHYQHQWNLPSLAELGKQKRIPTRSTQTLFLQMMLPVAFQGPPRPTSVHRISNWATASDVKTTLQADLGRYGLTAQLERWGNTFASLVTLPRAAESTMFFICAHKWGNTSEWLIGATTPMAGVGKKKYQWGEKIYRAIREQGLGTDHVERVRKANDTQQQRELELIAALGLPPGTKPTQNQILPIRQQVLRELPNDINHGALITRPQCSGVSIDNHMVPTPCCYRCRCNFQYGMLPQQMVGDTPALREHLMTFDWKRQMVWPHQCAECMTVLLCNGFDKEQKNKASKQQEQENAKEKAADRHPRKTKSVKHLFGFKR